MEFTAHASGSAGNLYEVTAPGHPPLLIEAGVPFKALQRSVKFRVSQLAGALIGHSHGDHSQSVPKLLAAGVDCYMSVETASELGVKGHHRVRPVFAEHQFTVGPWAVVPLELTHDVPCLGFLVASKAGERLLYVSDTAYCKYRFDHLSILAIEANYSRGILDRLVEQGTLDRHHAARVVRNHMSIEHAAQLLVANDLTSAREVHLLHLSGGNSHADEFKAQIERLVGLPVYIAGERGVPA